MKWKIKSKVIDTYELSNNDIQDVYLIYVLDENERPIVATEAYGIEDRVYKTRMYTVTYGRYLVSIEHE